jgi:hypothetical protein
MAAAAPFDRHRFIEHTVRYNPLLASADVLNALSDEELQTYEPPQPAPPPALPATGHQRGYIGAMSATPPHLSGDVKIIASAVRAAQKPDLTRDEAHDIIETLQQHVQPTS